MPHGGKVASMEKQAEDLVVEVVGNPDDWYTFRFSADKLSKMVRMLGGKDLTRLYRNHTARQLLLSYVTYCVSRLPDHSHEVMLC